MAFSEVLRILFEVHCHKSLTPFDLALIFFPVTLNMAVCNGVIFFCEPRFDVVLVILLLTNEAEDDRGFGLAGCGGAPPQ